MPFMYWSWKGGYPSKIEAIKFDASIFSLDNMNSANTFTIAMCWSGIKLTWTPPSTIATVKIVDLSLPFSFGSHALTNSKLFELFSQCVARSISVEAKKIDCKSYGSLIYCDESLEV